MVKGIENKINLRCGAWLPGAALIALLAVAGCGKKEDCFKSCPRTDTACLRNKVKACTEEIKANPNDSSAYVHLGNAHYDLGESDMAEEDFSQATARKHKTD